MRHRQATRALFALLFALGLVLGVASVACASTESTYAAWTAPVYTDTPHGGYTTSTTKCAVCHAVHKAPAGGELLLRTTVAEACVYCHITKDLGVIRIYDGDPDLYYGDNKKNHSRDGGAPCSGCHSVHGADVYGGAISAKILKRLPIQPELLAIFDPADTHDPNLLYEAEGDALSGEMTASPPADWGPTAIGFEDWEYASGVQQTAFCTGCHPYYTQASENPITTSNMIVEGVISTETRTFASHPMRRQYGGPPDIDGNDYFNFQAKGSTLPDGMRVARMSTNGCYRCHGENEDVNLGVGVHASSFPHYTEIRERFLMSADVDGNSRTLDAYGDRTIPIPTPDSRQDGTCFYCHSWDFKDGPAGASNPSGVGFTY
jgi:predicted CXXCH cytochrome family protein